MSRKDKFALTYIMWHVVAYIFGGTKKTLSQDLYAAVIFSATL